MKWTTYLFFILLLSSCSSFERMQYRHVRKVPASPVVVEQRGNVLKETASAADTVISLVPVTRSEVFPQPTASLVDTSRSIVLPAQPDTTRTLTRIMETAKTHPVLRHVQPAPRRDLSLLVALILIFAGLTFIGYCVFLIPTLNILLGFRLILEAMFLIAAWKCLKYGIGMFVARFRTPRTYKED